MHVPRTGCTTCCSLLVLGLVYPSVVANGAVDARGIRLVRSAADLPRHAYPFDRSVSAVFREPRAMAQLAGRVQADIQTDLERYALTDSATLLTWRTRLVNAALVRGDQAAALVEIEKLRKLKHLPATQQAAGFPLGAILRAERSGAAHEPAMLRARVRRTLNADLDGMSWEVVRDHIMEQTASLSTVNVEHATARTLAECDRMLPLNNQELPDFIVAELLDLWVTIHHILPYRDEVMRIVAERAERAGTPAPGFAGRGVTLDPSHGSPVIVAIWDSGLDLGAFPERVWRNPREQANGIDDDHNGFIDDLHGIAHGLYGQPEPDLLTSLEPLVESRAEVERRFQGYSDLLRFRNTADAAHVRKLLDSLDPDGLDAFFGELQCFADHSHGTAIASVAAEGNPFIRLLPVRADYHMRPFWPTREAAEAHAAAQTATVAYFRQARVRVVNMSWSESLALTESYVPHSTGAATTAERCRIAQEYMAIINQSLHDAIKNAPEILFITSAGNLACDVTFDGLIPGAYDLPNLVAVGAVDDARRPWYKTCYGEKVKLYAPGVDVPGRLPGGRGYASSGTSIACPGVTNLAAKLLAIDPKLTPVQLIDLMVTNGEPLTDWSGGRVIHPQRTVEALRRAATLSGP